MKIFLLILLVIVIMLIAKGIASQYKEKNTFYVSIMQFLNSYELNIGFKKDKIKDLVEKIEAKGQAKILFEEYKGYLTDETALKFEDVKVITEEEKNFLIEMFTRLGTNDYSNEMTQLKVFKSYIQDKINISDKESNKNYPLIMKLSFLFSLGLALVLI